MAAPLGDQARAEPRLLLRGRELGHVVPPERPEVVDDVVGVPGSQEEGAHAWSPAPEAPEPGRGVADRAMEEGLAHGDDQVADQHAGEDLEDRRHGFTASRPSPALARPGELRVGVESLLQPMLQVDLPLHSSCERVFGFGKGDDMHPADYARGAEGSPRVTALHPSPGLYDHVPPQPTTRVGLAAAVRIMK